MGQPLTFGFVLYILRRRSRCMKRRLVTARLSWQQRLWYLPPCSASRVSRRRITTQWDRSVLSVLPSYLRSRTSVEPSTPVHICSGLAGHVTPTSKRSACFIDFM